MTDAGRHRACFTLRLCAATLALGDLSAAARQEAPVGALRLTPRIDLGLQPVRVEVPSRFSNLPDTLTVNLPPGFSARVFAAFEDISRPRFMAFSPGGVLHVADMDDGQIVALPDGDGDGVADESIVLASGFSRPHSLAFFRGDLYVGDRPQILRFHDGDGDGIYEERQVFVDRIPSSGSHSTRTLAIDEAGGKIYLSVGWPCDLCRESDPERGAILQFDLDGSGRRVFATGVRNVVGMAIHPLTGQLWGTNNGHDLEGIDSPPEWVDVIRDGSFHGIPFAFGDGVYADFSIPAYRDRILPLTRADSLKVESMEPPAVLLPAHTAPMGIHFYTHGQFPERYHNAAFIALHAGHAKLAPIEGYSVVALFSQPDGADAHIADFLTGFQTGTEIEDVWAYPMGIASDAAGNLYISSDLGNPLILRVEHAPLHASWLHALPDSVRPGAPLDVEAAVQVERLAPGAGAPELRADLSALGGPADLSLEPAGDGAFRLRLRLAVPTDLPPGLKTVSVTVRQAAAPRDHVLRLTSTVALLPARPLEDLSIYDEGLAPGWTAVHKTWTEGLRLDLADDQLAFAGRVSASFRGVSGDWDWASRFRPERPVDPVGYDRLHFAFHPGLLDRSGQAEFDVYLGGTLIDLTGEGLVDMNRKEWQEVDIPLHRFGATPMKEVTFGGDFNLYYYLDDVRLVAAPSMTAVGQAPVTPDALALEPNYPNPFNSGTAIPFAIPRELQVELSIYNLAGQRVARVVDDRLPAGAHLVRWEGVDDSGRDLASGIYFYRVRAGSATLTRRLVLVH